MPKQRVAVLFGGSSSEHEVSLQSAKSVIEHLNPDKYEILKIGITKEGKWRLFHGTTDQLPDGSWQNDPQNENAFLTPDASLHGLAVLGEGSCRIEQVDVVFPVLHGLYGEDGSVQGLLELAKIPFVGCAVAASAVCMDKAITKSVLDAAGIPQTPWDALDIRDYKVNPEPFLSRIEQKLGYPVFVKPANAGSSVGISKAKDRAALHEAILAAAKHDRKVVFEQAVMGREIECAVLGNHESIVSVCGEILPCNEFYDYDAKYISGNTGLCIPAELPVETSDAIRSAATKAYKQLGCEGLTRMDFFIRDMDGAILLNEPNTIPGFTSISMYPKLFEATGIPYGELLDRLIALAYER